MMTISTIIHDELVTLCSLFCLYMMVLYVS